MKSNISKLSKERTKVYFDGGTGNKKNKNIRTCVVIQEPWKMPEILIENHDIIASSNEVEWIAAIRALIECERRGITEFSVYGDSQMVVNVINGDFEQHKWRLQLYRNEFSKQINSMKIDDCSFEWISRKYNLAGWAIGNQVEQEKLQRVINYYS